VRSKLVVGNWKSNGSTATAKALAAALASECTDLKAEVVMCPPFVFVPAVAEALAGTDIRVGAQDLSESGPGAYTGEVHAEMLVDVGCEYVIVGHSERRTMFGERDREIAHKLARAIAAGLRPILCVGESLDERAAGLAREVVLGQLDAVAAHLGSAGLEVLVIAYEPVWAIGTGQSATPTQAEEVHGWIRTWLTDAIGKASSGVRLLYGGSVTPLNSASLFNCQNIDGALVGSASLNAKDFLAICLDAAKAQISS
jgi:triosephosphate isomerase (TIM)